MATNVTLHAGHDVAYFTRGQHRGGCAGAMSYYTAAGEPPGEWAGKGAAALGLSGVVDPDVIERLYQENTGPGGELLVKRRQSRAASDREEQAVAAYLAGHPYASATELAEARTAERGKDPHQVPYFDLTVSAVKSVSVLHASYRVAARQARLRGDQDRAAALDARADEIEAALMESAREAAAWLEQHATYTRTGHHSARSGEWRDGAGLTASLFLHHLSRDGDPQLHVHVAIWNRVQRADGADGKWRTLDSRSLHSQRLAVAPVADRILETRLTALGYVMVPRADGNGAEVGGVGQEVKDLFSSRAIAVTGELDRLVREYEAALGRAPSRRTLWLLHQQAGQNTRRTKADARRTIAGRTGAAEPTEAQRLAAWEAQTARREVQALSAVHTQVASFASSQRAARAPAALDDAAKRRAARIAVAEVQKHHAVWSMAQLRFEVHRALPVLEGSIDGPAVVDEVARLAVGGRSGTDVVQVTAPDPADVTSLGMRASDGGSIYRPPNEERYCTLAHLDVEEQILATAKSAVPQLMSREQARAAVAGMGLNAEQRDAVVMMLTATTATTVLVAPAGAGKSHTMAGFARLWTTFTGRRVIGLTTSTNAARVLAHEGLAESYNIAQFLGKAEGSDELRRPVPLHRDDVLVLDEASQLATADLALIGEAARQAGARIIATGDVAQLGAVEAGGMFRLLAREVPAAQLHEVRRFDAEWERQASIRLRDGDLAAVAAYDRHGRIRGADYEAAYDRAASMWLADHLRGKDVLLLAGSNAEAAGLARRVQAKLTQLGTIGPPQAALGDGNHAGVGDLIRARLNTHIDAAGRPLTNRDTLKITAFRGPDAEVRRQRLDGTWTGTFRVPRAYLAASAELAYAGNVHVAQGRTVDTAHLLVTDSLSRQALYVGMTRGRQANTAHVLTGTTAPPGHESYRQAAPESVLAAIMGRDDGDLSATEQIRQAQDWAAGTGHLLNLWTAAIRQTLHHGIDQQITARLTESEARRYQREPSRPALQRRLRAAQLAGHEITALIGQITAAPMDGARSIASVLHGRLQRIPLPHLVGHDLTWAQRTPASAPAVAHELATALDARARALGDQLAVSPEPWLARHIGVLSPAASPALREEYARRASAAGLMGYRTPNIDRIAAEGMRFTDSYGEQSCTAGRSSFITGQSVYRTGLSKVGMPGADVGLQAGDATIAELLKPLGYATGQFGKNHLGDMNKYLPTVHGFDEFFGNLYHLNAEEEPEHPNWPPAADFPQFARRFAPRGVIHSWAAEEDDPTEEERYGRVGKQRIEDTGPLTMKRMETIDDETVAACIDFIGRQHEAGKPFFVWMNTTHMHFRTHTKPESLGQAGRWQSPYHDTMIDHDKHVGLLLDTLDELGIAENTIVVYSTDNGPHMNSWPDAGMTPFRSEKDTNWEGAFRIPELIRWPGKIPAGAVSNDIIQHHDWLPTFLAAAGDPDIVGKLKAGHAAGDKTFKVHIDGYNLLPYLTGQTDTCPRQGLIYFSDDGDVLAIRFDNWKVVFMEQRAPGTLRIWAEPFVPLRVPKLFNLRTDPFERADVTSNTYYDWLFDNDFIVLAATALVTQFLETFKEFPPRQKAASFTIDQVVEKLEAVITSHR